MIKGSLFSKPQDLADVHNYLEEVSLFSWYPFSETRKVNNMSKIYSYTEWVH